MSNEFGDFDADDAVADGDENVDLTRVDEVAEQIESIQAIPNENDRLEAAEQWAAELGGTA